MPNWTENPYFNALIIGAKVVNPIIKYHLDPDGGVWTIEEMAAAEKAFSSWSSVANLTFEKVDDKSTAHFIEVKTTTNVLGAEVYAVHDSVEHSGTTIKEETLLSSNQGPLTGQYATDAPGWDAAGLMPGGEGFTTLVHEIGHGLGLDHTHLEGDTDPHEFPGVDGDDEGPGDNGLNDLLYSVMSYQNGPLIKDMTKGANTNGYGVVGGPMAFDIAVIQYLYGANTTTGAGDTTYKMPDANVNGTFWTSIWDVGGTDTIEYDGVKDTEIDLRAATLKNEVGGGGYASHATGIFGGYTIANSVVIENAIGGAGHDKITGNTANNVLRGNGGNDELNGMAGVDWLYGDAGDDTGTLSNKDASNADIYAGRFEGGDGTDNLLLNKTISDYNVVKNGKIFKFYDKNFTDVKDLGRLIATAKDIEKFEDVDITAQNYSNNFNARSTQANGTAPTDLSTIRDYDGNDLGQASGWKLIGKTDVQLDDDVEFIYINQDISRWATVGTDQNGQVDFSMHGQGGDTRVVGIYIDPEVEAGRTIKFSEFDSQQRFQNDLKIDNLTVIDAFDFDKDGFQEIYFKVNDGTAYLRALMHDDGNIQYANYQVEQQVQDYLTGLGYDQSVLDTILV